MSIRAWLTILIGATVVLVVLVLVLPLRSGGPPQAGTASAVTPSGAAPSRAGPSGAAPSGDEASHGPTSTPAVLVGAGDIADCRSPGDEATAALLDTLEGTVFTLGDNVYDDGTLDEFQRCYDPGWGRQLARTRPVPGNHEYRTKDAVGYFAYFGAAAHDPATGWYAYDAGAWRVYVLNSNCALIGGCDTGSPQQRWLRDDLAANPRTCVLAMWHHPLFSSGEHGNDASTADLWQTLADADAELVLDGHDHDYERFAPQTATGVADDRGIVEIVVGTGGRSHYAFQTIRANSVARDDTTFGVLRLSLAEDGWTAEFVPVEGASFTDGGSGTCH